MERRGVAVGWWRWVVVVGVGEVWGVGLDTFEVVERFGVEGKGVNGWWTWFG